MDAFVHSFVWNITHTDTHMLILTLIKCIFLDLNRKNTHSKHGLLQRTTKTPNLICIDNHQFRQMQMPIECNAFHDKCDTHQK